MCEWTETLDKQFVLLAALFAAAVAAVLVAAKLAIDQLSGDIVSRGDTLTICVPLGLMVAISVASSGSLGRCGTDTESCRPSTLARRRGDRSLGASEGAFVHRRADARGVADWGHAGR
jgi:hypothetical protein